MRRDDVVFLIVGGGGVPAPEVAADQSLTAACVTRDIDAGPRVNRHRIAGNDHRAAGLARLLARGIKGAGNLNGTTFAVENDLAVFLMDAARLNQTADTDHVVDEALGGGGGDLNGPSIRKYLAIVRDQRGQRLTVASHNLARGLLVHRQIDFLVAVEIDDELIAGSQNYLSKPGIDDAVVDDARSDKGSQASFGDSDVPVVFDDAGGLGVALELIDAGVEVRD